MSRLLLTPKKNVKIQQYTQQTNYLTEKKISKKMLQVKNTWNTLKVDFKDSTTACPAPSCGGDGYWAFGVVIPERDIPVTWIWDSESFCCSSASLLSGQSLVYNA